MADNTDDESLEYHRSGRPGKIEVVPSKPTATQRDLSLAYTPGVAKPCLEIARDPSLAYQYTAKGNLVAVVTNGTAVLGLGDIGALAGKPVMEGKAVLFKRFADIDVFDIEVDTHDTEEFIRCVNLLEPTFGGINLEDIAAPACFEIEERLKAEMKIPVFHDDQHGTAVVVLAGVINALRITGKSPESMKVVIAGAGAAGVACTRILKDFGIGDLVVCDTHGAIHDQRDFGKNPAKQWLAAHTNQRGQRGPLKEVLEGADMFLGLSAPGLLSRKDVLKMNKDPIVFAMSNPVPEVMPEDVHDIVAIMATGRSDYPNQINNVLAFPGIFRGALDARASEINETMKHAAAEAIAGVIPRSELGPDYIVPSVFNKQVAKQVATAVARAAHRTHVAHRLPKGTSIYHV